LTVGNINIRYSLLKKIGRLINPLLRPIEKHFLKEVDLSNIKTTYSPVFIVGAPRTGSTFLYQSITNSLRVFYIDNLMDVLYRNLLVGANLSNKLFKNKPHNCFKSFYGNTFKYGMHAPSECGDFWYQWLPRRQYFAERNTLKEPEKKNLRDTVYSVINKYDKPFVFKNLSNSLRLGLLSEVFPNAKVIFVKRDPLFTSLSILRARRKFNIKNNELWSIKPSDYNILETMGEYEMIVNQVYSIEKQIFKDKALFSDENFMNIHFESFCRDPETEMKRIKNFIHPDVSIDYSLIPDPIVPDNHSNHQEESAIKELTSIIQRFNWDTYEE
jgi:hypothetical protein